MAKRSSEGDQQLELGYDCSTLFGFSGSGRSQNLRSTTLTILVETEGRYEETQACHHDKLGSSNSRQADDERPYRRPDRHDGTGDEDDRPRGVMAIE